MANNTVRHAVSSTRSRRGLGVLVALGVAACQNPADALYDAPDAPLVVARPDPDVLADCEECADASCADERAACLDDADCRALLACKGACGDPTCQQECTAKHGYSPWFEDLWACALIDECAQLCNSGANFACVDRYRAPRAEDAGRFGMRFRYKNPRTGLAYAYTGDERDEQFVVGAEARSCPPQDLASTECQPIDQGTVDATNTFALDLIAHQVTRAFGGVVEVELPDQAQAAARAGGDRFRQLGWRDRYFFPPLAQSAELRFYVFWRGWIRQAVLGETPEARLDFETAAPLAIYFEDCTGAPARGVRLELEADDGIEVDVLNQLSDGSFDDATDTGSALVGDVPEPLRDAALTVQAVEVESERVLARRSDVFVRPGWTTHVWLTPHPER
jgi:hypothetical protein